MDFRIGLNIISGHPNSGATSTIVNLVNLESNTKKVLFLSLETGFNSLIEKYHLSGNDSITLIDNVTSINELDEELTNNKYDVVYIDYLMLLKTENDLYEEKVKELIDLSNKHNITIVASDLLSENESTDKYKEETFKDVATIQSLDMIL